MDLAGLVHANGVGQMRNQGVRMSHGQHLVATVGLAPIGSLGNARVVVLDLVQGLEVHPSPMRVVVLVATQPVLESDVDNVDHEDGKGVLVAGLNELFHGARLLVSSGHLFVVELLGMLASCSRMELVVKEDGVQLVLVDLHDHERSLCAEMRRPIAAASQTVADALTADATASQPCSAPACATAAHQLTSLQTTSAIVPRYVPSTMSYHLHPLFTGPKRVKRG
eukprot:5237223-Pleurochrysis_carterae.AAC.3